MFTAEFISLSGDLVYRNVQVLGNDDYEKLSIPKIFDGWTCTFLADGKCYHVHQFKVNLIKIDSHPRTSNYPVEEIIIGDEMRYQPAYVIPQQEWAERNIMNLFCEPDSHKGQFAWCNHEGTFITLESNVVSIISPDPRRRGPIVQPPVRPLRCTKANKQAVVAQIKPRS